MSLDILNTSTSFIGEHGSNDGTQETGVYVGIQQMEYSGMAAPYMTNIVPFSATGSPFSVAAGRLSYTYGFKGPAVSPSQ